MVDRIARDRYAELLRHFAAGNLTNDEYEDAADPIVRLAKGKDRCIWAIWTAVWFIYSDVKEHRLRGEHALLDDGRRTVARWILFLYSDLEYEWPIKSFVTVGGCLISFCTLGIASRILRPIQERRLRRIGSWELWPFFRQGDYDAARARPRLLCGAR